MSSLIDKVDRLLNCKHEVANKLLEKSDVGEETSEAREARLLQSIKQTETEIKKLHKIKGKTEQLKYHLNYLKDICSVSLKWFQPNPTSFIPSDIVAASINTCKMLGQLKHLSIDIRNYIPNESAIIGEKNRIKQAVFSMLSTSCFRMHSGTVLIQCC